MKILISLFITLVIFAANISAQTTVFTYQGKISDTAGTAALYDFEFKLFDALTGGTEIGTQTRLGVAVSSGIFTVQLDFGAAAFNSSPRYLEIFAKPAGGPTFTPLTPRQLVASAPHAIKSLSAATAATAGNVTGIVQIANGGTGSATQNFVDLSTAQTVAGDKTFTGSISALNLSGTNTGNVALAPVGSAPNLNGATLTGQLLALQPANATNPGVVSTGTQTIAGNKTFSNNVTVSGTFAAALGQDATTVFGTSQLSLCCPNSLFNLIPGLTQTVTVPANSTLYISTDGGMQTSAPADGFSSVEVAIHVNGVPVINGGFRKLMALNTSTITGVIENWSFGTAVTLSAGVHTIDVRARGQAPINGNALVSGDSTSVLQGQLTVIIVKR